MSEGISKILTAKVLPVGAPQLIGWTSSEPTIATVSASGEVLAIKEGVTNITARAVNGVSSICKVTVTAAP